MRNFEIGCVISGTLQSSTVRGLVAVFSIFQPLKNADECFLTNLESDLLDASETSLEPEKFH